MAIRSKKGNMIQKLKRFPYIALAVSGLMLTPSCGDADRAVVAGRFLECAGQSSCNILVNDGSVLLHSESEVFSTSITVSDIDADGVRFTMNGSARSSEMSSGVQTVEFGETVRLFRSMTVSVEEGPVERTAYITLH